MYQGLCLVGILEQVFIQQVNKHTCRMLHLERKCQQCGY
jgi:hypothetical protein